MQYIYKTNVVINAVEKYLEANPIPKDAPYSRQVLFSDQFSGWLETMLKLPSMPNYVTLDDDDLFILADWLVEV